MLTQQLENVYNAQQDVEYVIMMVHAKNVKANQNIISIHQNFVKLVNKSFQIVNYVRLIINKHKKHNAYIVLIIKHCIYHQERLEKFVIIATRLIPIVSHVKKVTCVLLVILHQEHTYINHPTLANHVYHHV